MFETRDAPSAPSGASQLSVLIKNPMSEEETTPEETPAEETTEETPAE